MLKTGILITIALSVITVSAQFKYISNHYGKDYVQFEYQKRFNNMANNTAPAPHKYRLLTTWALSALAKLPVEFSTMVLAVRLVQNMLIFLLAFYYFRSFGMLDGFAILGVVVTAYAMNHAYYQSDPSCHFYTQMVIMLLAGLAINYGKWLWLVVVSVLSAFNREETVFIPVLLVALRPDMWMLAASILGTYIGVNGTMRFMLGWSDFSGGAYGYGLGWRNFVANVFNQHTWSGLSQMYGVMPVLALLSGFNLFLMAGIAWVAAYFVTASAQETRLFLMPLVMVFIPLALCGLPTSRRRLVYA